MPTISLRLPPRLHQRQAGENAGAYDKREATAFGEIYAYVLQAAAIANALWILGEWEQYEAELAAGRTPRSLPKCCAKCQGIKYAPNDLTNTKIGELEILLTPELIAAGQGSCDSIAAWHTGHKIAEATTGNWFDGKKRAPISWDEALRLYHIKVERGPDPNQPRLFHAACMDDGKRIDAVLGMQRTEKKGAQ